MTERGTEAAVVVAGHLMVDPDTRDDYLAGCLDVVRQARETSGCLDFAISADVLDPGRVNVYERWVSRAAVEALPAYAEHATYHLASVGWLRRHVGWKEDSKSDEEPG